MKLGSLFSGGGLGDFGFELAGYEIVWQVEIDNYCQKILNLRWPDVPKYKDIKTVKGKNLPTVDVIFGGFPCQPFSVAGKQRGAEDDRYLWPEMFRIIQETQPTWVIIENVPGIIGIALNNVCNDLEAAGYEVMPPIVFPAHALGAPHRRNRIWIVGYSRSEKSRRLSSIKQEEILSLGRTSKMDRNTNSRNGNKRPLREMAKEQNTKPTRICSNVSNSLSKRLQVRNEQRMFRQTYGTSTRSKFSRTFTTAGDFWEIEPRVGRVVNGMPNRMDRLKLLGNGIVIQVAYFIGKTILEFTKLK